MGLLDEIEQDIKSQPQKKWGFFNKTMVEIGDKKEQDEFIAALDNETIPLTAIYSVLKKRGITVSQDTLRRWRNDRKS